VVASALIDRFENTSGSASQRIAAAAKMAGELKEATRP